MRKIVLAAVMGAAIMAAPARAITVLAQNLAGGENTPDFGGVSGGRTGQSFTVTPVGSYSGISFNFYSGASPVANGKLYLYNTEYTGTRSSLDASTADRVGVGIADGSAYRFDQSVNLFGGRTYYAYADGNFDNLTYSGSNPYAGGVAYQSHEEGSGFESVSSVDTKFTVSAGANGPSAPAPLAGLGLIPTVAGAGALFGTRFRRRKPVAA
jgi:hypothetical protein